MCHYEVLHNEKYGRYLVSAKDLDSGELIFTDKPFAFGPKPDTPPLCLGCYCPVEGSLCSRCGWPICGSSCEMSPDHASECAIFVTAKVRFQSVDDWTACTPQLDCITPLRMLLAKEKDPERWESEVAEMEDHAEARRQRPTWEADQTNIVNFLLDHCKLASRFSPELVQKICGILEVNSVEIPLRTGFRIRAIYPRLGIAAHNCIPNIVHTIQLSDFQVKVRAAVPIQMGGALHMCYTHALSPTLVRREHLLYSKFFSCDCPRCSDPIELGTHLGTLKCSKCDDGVLLSTNPLDDGAVWKCTEKRCEFSTSSGAVMKLLGVVQGEVDELDALPAGPTAIERREAFLNKYKSVFHPRHSVMVSVKQALAQLYGLVEGYEMDELPDVILERLVEFCRTVLGALNVVMPGESRMIGMMMYHLHAPLMFMARSEYAAGIIDEEKLKDKLQEPIQCLETAAKILMREDPQSPEGITGQIALHSVEQLKASVNSL